MTDAEHPVAGWYPDTERPGGLRWWDGSAWTEHSEPVAASEPGTESPDRLPEPEPAGLAATTATPTPAETAARPASGTVSPDWGGPARAAAADGPPVLALPAASWTARAWATIIDGLVAIFLGAIVAFIYLSIDGTTREVHDSGDIPTGLFVLLVGVIALYGPVLLAITGGWTVGRRVAGYRIAPLDSGRLGAGRAFYRELFVKGVLGVFTLPLLASYLWPLGESHQRALHDIFAGTRAVRPWRVPRDERDDLARRAGLEG